MIKYRNIKTILNKLDFNKRIEENSKILDCNEQVLNNLTYSLIQDFYNLTIEQINEENINE